MKHSRRLLVRAQVEASIQILFDIVEAERLYYTLPGTNDGAKTEVEFWIFHLRPRFYIKFGAASIEYFAASQSKSDILYTNFANNIM